jgi:hypothetical protein
MQDLGGLNGPSLGYLLAGRGHFNHGGPAANRIARRAASRDAPLRRDRQLAPGANPSRPDGVSLARTSHGKTRPRFLARSASRQRLGHVAEIDERTVDVHVGRLRKALVRGREKDPIRTVRGAGYSLDETLLRG